MIVEGLTYFSSHSIARYSFILLDVPGSILERQTGTGGPEKDPNLCSHHLTGNRGGWDFGT